MSFIRQLIERKISAATGATVTMGEFSFSPFSGALEMLDVKVSPSRFAPPALTIGRIWGKLSVTRALKQEIAIKELSIENPSLIIQIRSDGTSNLTKTDAHKSETPEQDKQAGGRLDFECEYIQLVDAQLMIHHFGHEGYKFAIEHFSGQIRNQGDDLKLEFTVGACGRRDMPVELGGMSLEGKLKGAGGFRNFASCGLEVIGKLASTLAVKVSSSVLTNRIFNIDLAGMVRLPLLVQLMPDDLKPPFIIAGDNPVNLKMRAILGTDRAIKIQSLETSATDLSISM